MTEIDETPQLTRIQLYCSALYNVMDENSEIVETTQGEVKTWSGYIGATADSLGIPEGVRTRVIKRLADIGSIQVIEQGRRNVKSLIALLAPPSSEVWEAQDSAQSGLTDRPDSAILAQEVRGLIRMLGGVDVPKVIANFEGRLVALEVEIKRLAQQTSGEGK